VRLCPSRAAVRLSCGAGITTDSASVQPFVRIALPYRKSSIDSSPEFRRGLLLGGAGLAACAGFVNAVVLSFFQAPVSHMSGAVSHLGLAVANAHGQVVGTLGVIAAFLAGSIVSGVVIGRATSAPGRRYGVVLLIEGTALALSALCLSRSPAPGVALAAFACGLQNATTSSYYGLGLRTTHVTGMVTDLGVIVGHWLRHQRLPRWKTALLLSLTGAFLAGGILGAYGIRLFDYRVLYAPGIAMLVAGAVYLRRAPREAGHLVRQRAA
jgi:Predicted membrane protein